MIVVEPKEVKFFTKPPETLIHMMQEENINIFTPVNNLNYYPYHGA